MTWSRCCSWAAGGASAAVSVDGAMARIELHGLITPSSALSLQGRIAVALREASAILAVSIWVRATILVDAAELRALLLSASPAMRLPLACVVRAEHLELFEQHAWDAAKLGFIRAPFLDEGQALDWARVHAAGIALARRPRAAPGRCETTRLPACDRAEPRP